MFLKDPAARLDYGLDWTDRLNEGRSILESSWSVEPAEADGLSIAESSRQANLCLAVLEGGIAGRIYRVSNRIGISDGSIDERSIVVRVDQR